MHDGTTIDLLRAARAGDEDAWSHLDERIRRTLRLTVRGQVPANMRAQFDTEVLLQSTLIDAYGSLADYEYQGHGSLQAWLRKIFRNKLRERIRRLRGRGREVDREAGTVHENLAGEDAPPEEEVARAEQLARVMAAFAELPRKESRLLTAFYFDKRSAVDLARSRGVSESTLRREVARALERLHDLLRRVPSS